MAYRVGRLALLVLVLAGCKGDKKSPAAVVDAGTTAKVAPTDLGLMLADLETRWNAPAAQADAPLPLSPVRELNAFRAELAPGLSLSGVAKPETLALTHLELVTTTSGEESRRALLRAASLLVGAISSERHDQVVLGIMSGKSGRLEDPDVHYRYESTPDAGAHLLLDPPPQP